ncbi:MAG TPA: Vms1/Ankzf1 family peptidyl-tRNA hydrolase, partial [Acidimicrobiales bacterium]|nr:Vms1/Ankzf1 family peptidyl-tRNA hydrolase [Acidimicrobiales bacterium]
PLVANAHTMGRCLAGFVTPGGLLHVEHHPDPPAEDLGRWAPLPLLTGVLRWRQASPPHVAVLADRRGADLFGLRAAGPNIRREAQGGQDLVGRSAPHGESRRRNHHRVESLWEQNAKAVSEEVVRLVQDVDARLVVAAGDVRALELLKEQLPKEVLDILHVVDGGRSADGSVDQVVTEVDRLVEAAVAHDTDAVLAKFREEAGQDDRASDGPARTLEALAMAQVETLLVHDDPADDRQGWFGPEPTHVALSEDTIQAMGVDDHQRARLVDVAVRAALGTGAGVRVIPGQTGADGPSDGLGAILRWGTGVMAS